MLRIARTRASHERGWDPGVIRANSILRCELKDRRWVAPRWQNAGTNFLLGGYVAE